MPRWHSAWLPSYLVSRPIIGSAGLSDRLNLLTGLDVQRTSRDKWVVSRPTKKKLHGYPSLYGAVIRIYLQFCLGEGGIFRLVGPGTRFSMLFDFDGFDRTRRSRRRRCVPTSILIAKQRSSLDLDVLSSIA